ncbi:hypothetical protein V2J09_021667 [Rumex salicifolius]
MAPAEDNNWLSFSLSSMEMLVSSAPSPPIPLYHHQPSPPASSSQHFLLDHFYANEWINPRAAEMAAATDGMYEAAAERGGLGMITGFLESQQQSVPKLENFLGGETTSSLNTQDSSTLTNIYDPNPAYFNDISLPPPVTGGGFQAFSANSGSEVDDSQIACAEFVGQAIESNGGGLSSQFASGAGTLSLAVPQSAGGSEKAVVTVRAESDTSKKIADTFGQRTSIYRGVTRHRWTGRYEAHLWDNSCRREGQARKGRQGGYDKEDKAARAYDLAALKYWGTSATTNFPMSSYSKEIEDMKPLTKQEFIASLRRKSSGFSRGASMYRGVTRHHQQGRWQARIGRVAGNKDLYLGTFATEEEAAEAYDIAAIKFRGMNAVTNFEMNRYDVEAILRSALPVGGTTAKRMKVAAEAEAEQQQQHPPLLTLQHHNQPPEAQPAPPQGGPTNTTTINFAQQPASLLPYALPLDAASSYYQQGYFQSANALPLEWPTEFYLWPQQQPL